MISETLSGKTIALTGSTGFLGTAMVEKILRCIPNCQLLLLVRPTKRGIDRRIQTEIIKNDAFNRLREELGAEAFKSAVDKCVVPIAADITKEGLGLSPEDKKLLATADIFIHSAASVSFDSPFDLAVETNLVGPIRILETLNSFKSNPPLIAVSTAYVAGNRKGHVAETLLNQSAYELDVDLNAEIESSRRARIKIEDESRSQQMLAVFDKQAKNYLGSPGTAALSKRREQLRRTWVKNQMVEAGRSRAASLGFPDAYGMTKAMAETAMCQHRQKTRIVFVRPSIIESALTEPFPGWIRGFRMAEPIIISYARGILKDFPAKPEGILDVIPVDMVVSAICAAAAQTLKKAELDGKNATSQKGAKKQNKTEAYPEPEVINVASGSINPFLFEDLHDWCYNWFTKNPIYDDQNKPISPSQWSYPSRTRVNKQLNRTKRALSISESILKKIPIRGTQAQAVAMLEEHKSQIERALGYVELYGMYLECEAVFGTKRLFEMYESLPAADKKDFAFDPSRIDWHYYITEIHLPSVMLQGRVKTQPSKKDGSAVLHGQNRLRNSVLSKDRQLAVFDLENTIMASNVVTSWGWLASNRLSFKERLKFVAKTLMEAPDLLSLDRASRGDFLGHFYKRFEGASVSELEADSREMFNELLLSRCFPAAVYRVKQHSALGHRTLLITGALDFIVEPLRPLFDDIISAELSQKDGRYLGTLKQSAPIGELRADLMRIYAKEHKIDLQQAVVYADSVSDIPALEAVGFPVAVNPEVKLATIARRRGWLVENFKKSKGAQNKLLPINTPIKGAHT